MSESTAHMTLVNLLASWIAHSFLNGDYGHILIDRPGQGSQRKPPTVYDFTPDVYVINTPRYSLIIGEAKTARDVDNRHALEQIKAFLCKCAEYETSLFVFAVPWHRVRLARSVIEYCKRKTGLEEVRTTALEGLPG